MPTDFKLNTDSHDIDLSSGTVELHTSNPEVVAQRVKIAILTKQGEWFRNITAGLPYYQEFFSSKNNKEYIDKLMVEYINSVEDVNSVISYESTIENGRRLNISVTIETDRGEISEISVRGI